MPTCKFCGKETTQPDASYCTYCGSSLVQEGSVAPETPFQSQPSQVDYTSMGRTSEDISQRYEKALRRVEQLDSVLVLLSVAAVILVLA